MSKDCLFCGIASKSIPSRVVFEDDLLIAIEDIHPQAPVHLLVFPKRHYENGLAFGRGEKVLAGGILLKINDLARERGLENSGFRVVMNCGNDGGQTVPHVHFHLLGGRAMKWPPG